MSETVSILAQKLRPFWLRDLGASSSTQSGGGGGMIAHALNGPYHTGTLDASQAPWALTSTRTLTAGAGLTGGGDLSVDRSFAVGAGNMITVGADTVAVADGGAYQFVGTGAGAAASWRNVSELAGNGLTSATGVLAVGVSGLGLGVGADAVTLTSSSNPGAAASILATGASGELQLYNGFFTQGAQSAATFASGFAGSGWRADYGITTASRASIETDDLTVRGRMRVYELLIQQIRATNGSIFVSSASKVVTTTTGNNPVWTVNGSQLTFNGSNATFVTTIYTITTAAAGDTSKELYHGFLVGDIIRAQQTRWNGSAFAGVIQSNLEVTSVANLYTYNGTFVSGDAPAIGYDYVRLGSASNSARQGSVYITSDDSAAPFIDIVDGVYSHTVWNSAAVARVRVGKLTGITDWDFGGALSGYGLYGTNVYLKGSIYASSGVFNGMVYAAGGVFNGTVRATDGSFNGTVTAASGTIGGWTVSSTSLTAGSGANTVGIDSGGTNPAIYAGSATPGSAPFRVTKTGDLTATSATITGAITASSGGVSGNFYVGSDVGASGNLYVGSNADIRMSGDGIRLVLPNLAAPALATSIPTNSSALRWFSNIGSSWTNAANYTGQISYRDTTNKVVDWVAMSFVGSTDYATYYARSMLYANRYNGSTHKECRIEATVDPNAGGAYVTATCDTMYVSNNLYVTSNMSALTITDRTPHYDGDALAELRAVKGNRAGGIDHGSLPAFARATIRRKEGEQEVEEEGRDLGAMISILTVAVQQLDARLDTLERRKNGN